MLVCVEGSIYFHLLGIQKKKVFNVERPIFSHQCLDPKESHGAGDGSALRVDAAPAEALRSAPRTLVWQATRECL